MKPTIFLNAWCKISDNHKGELLQYWYKSKLKTALMEEEIYPELAQEFSMRVSSPYYFIDSVFYSIEDRVPEIPDHNIYLRKIKIGLEHENVFDFKLYRELSHLLLINCDLRVIVSYPHNYDKQPTLNYLLRILSNHNSLKVLAKNDSVLLILGVREEDNIFWEGYVYKDDNWIILHSKHSIGSLLPVVLSK